MASRLNLQYKLEEIVENVYFQPPVTEELQYPCIKYQLNKLPTTKADNMHYLTHESYTLTLITRSCGAATTELIDRIHALPRCQFDRHYQADGLQHYVFVIYQNHLK